MNQLPFENTFKGEDGVRITLENGQYTRIESDLKITGSYRWDTKDNDYYIHVQAKDNQNYEYRYRASDEGGSLCLLDNNQCRTIYLPIN